MTAELRCRACGHRFGKRARGLLVVEAMLVCHACAGSANAHRKVFPSCTTPHTPREHGGAIVTVGVARQIIHADPEWFAGDP